MAKSAFPETVPPIGASFNKPYMEFEYSGQIYRIEDLKGGHNGYVKDDTSRTDEPPAAKACKANPPVWDPEKQRWVVPLDNNIIQIDLSDQPTLKTTIQPDSPFLKMKILNNTRPNRKTRGMLITSGSDPDGGPEYPVDCLFEVYVSVKVPGKPRLENRTPFRLLATDLHDWPPKAGTTYKNLDDITLFPAFVPFAERFMRPVVRIPKNDQTILDEVFEWTEDGPVTLSKL